MKKRGIKKYSGFGLLVLMSISLVVTTLHSHHHLDLNHPPDFVDTGSCITTDTTTCPICGIFKLDTPPVSLSTDVFLYTEQVIVEESYCITHFTFAVTKGRSPPFAA